MEEPRLRRGSYQHKPRYPLGEIPDDVLRAVGRLMVYRAVVGIGDVSGDGFGDIFAEAVGGTHYASPVGVVDVACGVTGWSVKTVKKPDPFTTRTIRLVSGRNSPDYSYGISDPRYDIQKTGSAVLTIWNQRIQDSLSEFHELRTAGSFATLRTGSSCCSSTKWNCFCQTTTCGL